MERETINLIIASLSGAVVGGLITIIITLINKYFEDKRNKRETLIRTAVENWRASVDLIIETQKETKQNAQVYPLDDYIIHISSLAEIMTGNKIKPEKLKEALGRSKDLRKIAEDFRKEEG